MTRSGTGARTGTSWSKAFSATSNLETSNIISGTVRPGDTRLIGGTQERWVLQTAVYTSTNTYLLPPVSQTYAIWFPLAGAASGSANAPKTIRGVNRGYGPPVFFGTQKTRSYTKIKMEERRSYPNIEISIFCRDSGPF